MKPNYQKLHAQGFRFVIVVFYDGPYGEKGDLISKHISYEAAEKASRKYGNWCGIRCISDYA